MKTLSPEKIARFAAVTLSLSLFAGAIASAIAAEPLAGKGGAILLTKAQPAVSAPAPAAMSCPTCKSEYVTRKDSSARGAIKPTQVIERHLCQGCDTKMAMTGVGKTKKTIAVHQCTAAPVKTMACCAQ